MAYSNILIAIDASDCSMNAVSRGIELAKELNANVMLLCVVDMTSMVDSASVGAIIDKDVEEIYTEEATKSLERAIKQNPYGKITRLAEEGIPKEAISAIAEENKADLIVMGTHGRRGLKHFFMGSVAEHIIRHSKIPVLVIPFSGE